MKEIIKPTKKAKAPTVKEVATAFTVESSYAPISVKRNKQNQLLEMLNASDRNLRFWMDKNEFGDIVGIVPVQRFYETMRGSIYFEYKDKIEDACLKFVVIDIIDSTDDFTLSIEDIKKKKIIEQNGMNYLKHHDIDFIFKEIMDIQ